MILSICDTPKVLEVMSIVNIIITIIRIVVPIVLLFSLVFKLIQASTKGDEDALASIKKKAVPSIIAATLIFIVPVLVNLIVSVSFPNSEYTKCIANISFEKIETIYTDKEEKLVSRAEETLNINDYVNAKNYIHNIKDNSKRESYESRLEEVKKLIDEAKQSVLGNDYDKVNYNDFSWKYYEKAQGPLKNFYSSNDRKSAYAIWGPNDVSDLNGVSLPLIIWLHGAGELKTKVDGNYFVKNGVMQKMVLNWDSSLEPIPAIIIAPHATSTFSKVDNYKPTIMAAIKYAQSELNIDMSKIVLMGHSMGADDLIAVGYNMYTEYSIDYFSAYVPFSPSHYIADKNYSAYNKKDVLNFYKTKKMKGYTDSGNTSCKTWFDWTEKQLVVYSVKHNQSPQRAFTEDLDGNGISDLVEWLFLK